jgi:hypothetical protein
LQNSGKLQKHRSLGGVPKKKRVRLVEAPEKTRLPATVKWFLSVCIRVHPWPISEAQNSTESRSVENSWSNNFLATDGHGCTQMHTDKTAPVGAVVSALGVKSAPRLKVNSIALGADMERQTTCRRQIV